MAERFVPDWLRQRAASTPARLALVAENVSWSFVDLDRRVDGAVQALRDRGLSQGERVGLLAPNGAAYVVAVHALMRLGAVIVPINTRLTASEIEWQVTDAELQTVLTDADLRGMLDTPAAGVEPRDFDLDAWHSVIYTSGTTGRPKGAILTYGNFWWSAVASALNLGLYADDAWLACLPLFHVGGLSILLRGVICGMRVVVHPRFDPTDVNRAIDELGVTMVSLVSTMLDRVLLERGGRPFPSTLRCVLLGGGPAALPLLERAIDAGAPVVQTYGLTETASQLCTLAPEDALSRLGSAGKPLMGSQLRIADDGEILVNGPTVSPGYLHQPPRQGWLSTGDVGRVDDDGYLYVLDRRDDLIVSGGENVYPAEVEAALLAHPAVADAGVFGVPDPDWGRGVAARVALKPGRDASVDELLTFVRKRLAGYKVPRRIELCDALPRNAAGKLLRRELRIER